ncbi:hypothetical protein HYS50_00915 [Candidatus Woesearchaeota archaeon]|nr:hypothetical protein [Candidatus Woesearchaeota archaeon]
MEFLARGKRGEVFLTQYKGKVVVVKQARKDSGAFHRIENEAFWLKRLNYFGIGPQFIALKQGKLYMEYIKGEEIGVYLQHHSLSPALAREILEQCRILDQLHVNKLEMHHPVKHILLKRGKPSRKTVVMIDFERCKQTQKPKNVTQFVQFLLRQKEYAGKQVDDLLKRYKKSYSEEDYISLIQALFS